MEEFHQIFMLRDEFKEVLNRLIAVDPHWGLAEAIQVVAEKQAEAREKEAA